MRCGSSFRAAQALARRRPKSSRIFQLERSLASIFFGLEVLRMDFAQLDVNQYAGESCK